jgi:hypothetical protein
MLDLVTLGVLYAPKTLFTEVFYEHERKRQGGGLSVRFVQSVRAGGLPYKPARAEEAGLRGGDFRHGTVPPPEERPGFPLDLPERKSV